MFNSKFTALHRYRKKSRVRISLKPELFFSGFFPNFLNWWARGEDRVIPNFALQQRWRYRALHDPLWSSWSISQKCCHICYYYEQIISRTFWSVLLKFFNLN